MYADVGHAKPEEPTEVAGMTDEIFQKVCPVLFFCGKKRIILLYCVTFFGGHNFI